MAADSMQADYDLDKSVDYKSFKEDYLNQLKERVKNKKNQGN